MIYGNYHMSHYSHYSNGHDCVVLINSNLAQLLWQDRAYWEIHVVEAAVHGGAPPES